MGCRAEVLGPRTSAGPQLLPADPRLGRADARVRLRRHRHRGGVQALGPTGLWTLSILGTLLLGGLAVLITWLHAWRDVGRWLADQSLGTLAIGMPLAIAALLAALSFQGIRRVVP